MVSRSDQPHGELYIIWANSVVKPIWIKKRPLNAGVRGNKKLYEVLELFVSVICIRQRIVTWIEATYRYALICQRVRI